MKIKLCNNYNDIKIQADKYGFSINEHIENGYRYATKFIKGSRHVWSIREGWQTADLIDGRFTNHIKFNTLDEAFARQVIK